MTNIAPLEKQISRPSPFALLAEAKATHRKIRITVPPPPRRLFRQPTPEYMRAMRNAELAVWIRALKVRSRGLSHA